MKNEHLNRLGADIQAFVKDIEHQSRIDIEVETDDSMVGRNTGKPDPLVCLVNESGACVMNRFTARVSMIEEPGAGKPHAGICAGGVG